MTLTQGHFTKVNHIINIDFSKKRHVGAFMDNLHFITCSTQEEPLNFCLYLHRKYDCSLQINVFELNVVTVVEFLIVTVNIVFKTST